MTLPSHLVLLLTFLRLGLDLLDPKFLEALKLSAPDNAPPEYGSWLDKNISYYDPIFRGWRLRETVPLISRRQGSFKCWDDRCLYYIYGFPNAQDRDQHLKQHPAPPQQTEATLPVNGTSPPVRLQQPTQIAKPEQFRAASPVPAPAPMVAPASAPAPAPLPRLVTSTSSLPPLNTANPPSDRRDSLLGYSLTSDYPAQTRSAVEADVEPLLPPLKRSRVGHSRLQSIGELKLPRDTGPCLRCKVQAKPVRLGNSHHMTCANR